MMGEQVASSTSPHSESLPPVISKKESQKSQFTFCPTGYDWLGRSTGGRLQEQ